MVSVEPHTQVAIAGATGFVGRAVHAALLRQAEVTALSRSVVTHDAADGTHWHQCDLFQLASIRRALAGCEIALYLVHSMQTRSLAQGSFRDFDLLCADNFARACKASGIKRIIYLSGILPQNTALSAHLESRREVEKALAAHEVPVTSLRAAVIVGAGGSSFEMMQRLVHRLPALAVPKQLGHRVQPIALQDVVSLIIYCIGHAELAGKHYDIGGADVFTYTSMLRTLAQTQKLARPIVDLPVAIPAAARWVSGVTGYPPALVQPLVESLQHDMTVGDGGRLQELAGVPGVSFEEAVSAAIKAGRPKASENELQPKKTMSKGAKMQVLAAARLQLPEALNLGGVLGRLRYTSEHGDAASAIEDSIRGGRITLRWIDGSLLAVAEAASSSGLYVDVREIDEPHVLLVTLNGTTASGLQRLCRRAQTIAFLAALRVVRKAIAPK